MDVVNLHYYYTIKYNHLLKQKYFYLRADVGSSCIDLQSKCHHSQYTRHPQLDIGHIVGEVGGGQGDGDLHYCIIEHSREPQNGEPRHDVAKQWPTQCHTHKVKKNVQNC